VVPRKGTGIGSPERTNNTEPIKAAIALIKGSWPCAAETRFKLKATAAMPTPFHASSLAEKAEPRPLGARQTPFLQGNARAALDAV